MSSRSISPRAGYTLRLADKIYAMPFRVLIDHVQKNLASKKLKFFSRYRNSRRIDQFQVAVPQNLDTLYYCRAFEVRNRFDMQMQIVGVRI